MNNDTLPKIFSEIDTLGNKTGTWRYSRPAFSCKVSACTESCPAGNRIPLFMSLAAGDRIADALRAVKEENPLPGVCGRVCPHPCVKACNRAEKDEAVAVNEVERFLGDQADELEICLPEPAAPSGKTIAVIGAGPAGLSFAYHSAVLGHKVTILEAMPDAGGVLRSGIPSYRLPKEALDRDLSFIRQLNIELRVNMKVVPELFGNLRTEFDAVCIAVGANKTKRLNIEGENLKGVIKGLDFLRLVNQPGKHPDAENKVVVIGGGNTAIDAARCAIRLGAEALVLYRRSAAEMPALEDEIIQAKEEGVQFRLLAAPAAIVGKDGKVSAVRCVEMKLGDPDDSGRRRPEPVAGSEFEIETDLVITAIGESPAAEFTAGVFEFEIIQNANGWGVTQDKKIFVCGDAGPNKRTVAHAIGSGKRAAIAADAFFKNKNLEEIKERITLGEKGAVSAYLYRTCKDAPAEIAGPLNINPAVFPKTESVKQKQLAPEIRIKNFDEIEFGISATEAESEAKRCMNCGDCTDCGVCGLFCPDMSIVSNGAEGLPALDAGYCKGCGICAKECPRGIITMEEERK